MKKESQKESEEGYRILIQKIGTAVLVHDSTKKIVNSNSTAQRLFGLTEKQLLGKSAIDPDWHFLREDGSKMPVEEYPVNKVMTSKQALPDSVIGIQQTGQNDILWVLVNGNPVMDQNNNVSEVIITFIDITDRIRNNTINSSRFHLMQFAVTHSLDELLEETLNESEKLTNSLIGFYHFVEDDQISLTLQNWSTRTKAEFCKAEGKGLHYPIDRAGVWVDCVFQRKPVIHNNYATLPNRKGMPEGHAEVIRELVVPVIRGEKVKAILGVGNKPVDYSEKDIEAISHLADLAWEIAERKIIDEALHQSEKNYWRIVESSNDAIIGKTPDGIIYSWNKAAEKLYGYRAEEIMGKPVTVLAPASRHTEIKEFLKKIRNGKTVENYESERIRKDGTKIQVALTLSPIKDNAGNIIGISTITRDITEKTRLEKELHTANVYNRSLIEASLDPLVTISVDGKITDVNRATEKATGRKRSELIGTDFLEYFTEPDKARKGYQQVFANGLITNYPLAIRHKDGHITDVLYNASLYRDETGKVRGVFASARDITDRKHAEAVLQKSEDALKQAQRIAHLGSWHMDLATNEVVWSEVLYKIYGFDPTKPPPLYTESMKLFTPESWELLSSNIANTTQTGIPYELELETINKEGKRGWMWARGELVRNEDGTPVKVQGVVMDITERKQVEVSLREKEERLALATVKNGVGVWDWNLQTQEMIWDDSMYELYHIKREDFPGTEEAWRASLHPDDLERGDQEVEDAIAGRKPFETEFRVIWPNGEVRYIKAVAKVFRDENGKPLRMLGINMDVSERHKAEDMVRELNRDLEHRIIERTAQLEDANKELEAFSYSVSHDLRSPLRAIDGFSRILQENYNKTLDDEGNRLLNVIIDNANRMSQLIDDILKFSRTGRFEMNFSEIDMTALADDVYKELQPSIPKELKLKIGQLPSSRGDRAMIRQVFVNLLSNAIKFTGNKKNAQVEVEGYTEETENFYYVKDNGAGFDMQYVDKLFGVFQRLHNESDFEGTGIGLAIVKRIVTRHGGRVWAEGKLNEGATIFFTLPKLPKE